MLNAGMLLYFRAMSRIVSNTDGLVPSLQYALHNMSSCASGMRGVTRLGI